MIKGRLKTNANSLGVKLDRLFEGRLAKGIGFTGTILSLILGGLEVVKIL